MIVFIDNYDSFVYNLVQYLGALGADLKVFRNNVTGVEEIMALEPDGIVISPGPGTPDDAGISVDLVKAAADRIPVLGVCLGHQSICAAMGARIRHAKHLLHGKTSIVEHDGRGIFSGTPSPLEAGRYHSLAVDESSLPDDLYVSARSDDGEVMGVRHRSLPLEGVQFHPESILTEHGMKMMKNFLEMARRQS